MIDVDRFARDELLHIDVALFAKMVDISFVFFIKGVEIEIVSIWLACDNKNIPIAVAHCDVARRAFF